MPFEPYPPPSRDDISTSSGLYSDGRKELRLDVDEKDMHRSAQMAASGNFTLSPEMTNIHWVATGLSEKAPNWWAGQVAYLWNGKRGYNHGEIKDFPYSLVDVWLNRDGGQQYAYVTFAGKNGQRGNPIRLTYRWEHYREVNVEVAHTEGEKPTTRIDTWAHPDRPSNLVHENLSVPMVFERAGFKVTTQSLERPVPLTGAGPDERWSDSELRDMLETYLVQTTNLPPWSIYVLFASTHEEGTGVSGVMFDNTDRHPRQGCAIFSKSIDAYPESEAWRQRERFVTACHEIGHCFNLPHSADSLGARVGWFMSSPERDAASFMNSVAWGSDFFKTFEYGFSGKDSARQKRGRELMFLRHAPEKVLKPGSDLYLLKGNQSTIPRARRKLELTLRANRDGEKPIFKYMEPVTLEMKLTNALARAQEIDEHLLQSADCMTVIIEKDRQPSQILRPYARYCWRPRPIWLKKKPRNESPQMKSGHARYESLFVSAGLGSGKEGWYIADPGDYRLRVILQVNGEEVPSNELAIHVEPPIEPYKVFQKRLEQDFFCDDVGRLIALDGSRLLAERKREILKRVTEHLAGHPAAIHVLVALGIPLMRKYKQLQVVEDGVERRRQLRIQRLDEERTVARTLLNEALTTHKEVAIESLGHIDYKWYVDKLSDLVFEMDDVDGAVKIQDDLLKTVQARKVNGRPILAQVVREIKRRRDGYRTKRREDTPAGA